MESLDFRVFICSTFPVVFRPVMFSNVDMQITVCLARVMADAVGLLHP